MKFYPALVGVCTVLCLGCPAQGASSIPAFYGDPPDDHHPWAIHDGNRPQPKIVTPGTFSSQEQPGKPPSDAVILFNGSDLSDWESANEGGGPAKWRVKDGVMEVEPKTGNIRTKAEFGDCQLHIEWAEPEDVEGKSQGRGNSGLFFEGLCEIQVLDSYDNITYADGHAASVYGQHPPMANALRSPGQFQVYDIIFRRPVYKGSELVDPGYVTVFVNGVLVQDHAVLEGPTGHMQRAVPGPFPEKGPLLLQDHGNPVRFRNIWYRPLPPRPSEGGTDGYLTKEATMAKRKEIATQIRLDAAKMTADSTAKMLRLMESLVYEKDEATMQAVVRLAFAYVEVLRLLPPDKLAAKKDEAKEVNRALEYLTRFNILPADFAPKVDLGKIVKEQKWDKK